MRVEVILENICLPGNILRMLGNDVEVAVSFNKTAWRCARSSCSSSVLWVKNLGMIGPPTAHVCN